MFKLVFLVVLNNNISNVIEFDNMSLEDCHNMGYNISELSKRGDDSNWLSYDCFENK